MNGYEYNSLHKAHRKIDRICCLKLLGKQIPDDINELEFELAVMRLLGNARKVGKEINVPDKAQIAFEYFINESKNHDLSSPKNFAAFELLFFNLVFWAFQLQRYTAESEQLICIEYAQKLLDYNCYNYISTIYNIFQIQFRQWLEFRESFNKNTEEEPYEQSLNRKIEHWKKIKNLATKAKDYMFSGILANKVKLISDVMMYVEYNRAVDHVEEIENFIEYLDIQSNKSGYPTFISECFDECGFDDELADLLCPWIRECDSTEYFEKKDNQTNSEFCDKFYYDIMMLPKIVDPSNYIGHFLTSMAQYAKNLKQEQEKKQQIIAEFAHTYGNMQATTLHKIGVELLSVDDDLLHEWGRKIMVEYAIKENLTKEVEILKLQFEDNTSTLIQKLKNSLLDPEGKSVNNLVSDALQRCFMSLLYGETRSDKSKRKLYFGSDDFAEKREELQEAFEQDVLVGEADMLTWVNKNDILNVHVKVYGDWKKMNFEDGGYAALLITNWITELITNAIKYSNKSCPIFLDFTQSDDLLIIKLSNRKEQSAVNIHGSQKGIESIAASIHRLNLAVGCDTKTNIIEEDDINYNLQLIFSTKVFFD